MKATFPSVQRESHLFYSDASRVITQFFMPGGPERARRLCERIMQFGAAEGNRVYREVVAAFNHRHRNLAEVFRQHYYLAIQSVAGGAPLDLSRLSEEHKLLLGAYFTKEYSIEAAAFFNPSIVSHPDQGGLAGGSQRFIVSFRAVGEGHLSSIVFRTGVVDANLGLAFDPVSPYVQTPEIVRNPSYDKHTFSLKLNELGVDDVVRNDIMAQLGDIFSFKELEDAIWIFGVHNPPLSEHDTIRTIKWLANSNYQMSFPEAGDLSERVIFPYSDNESRGIEDARFVRFVDDDGQVTYYATYTAVSGHTILPQLLETKDFLRFAMITLNGPAVRNKGMALFPRRLKGQYWMLGRLDGENLYVIQSDNLHFWGRATMLLRPRHDWDLMAIGNCGSPIETPEGWLVLTHGVGPLRQYVIGAALLDLENPAVVRAYVDRPLLAAVGREREGYVPNVVYSCGAMAHHGHLLIPYAMSDTASGFVTVNLKELVGYLVHLAAERR